MDSAGFSKKLSERAALKKTKKVAMTSKSDPQETLISFDWLIETLIETHQKLI